MCELCKTAGSPFNQMAEENRTQSRHNSAVKAPVNIVILDGPREAMYPLNVSEVELTPGKLFLHMDIGWLIYLGGELRPVAPHSRVASTIDNSKNLWDTTTYDSSTPLYQFYNLAEDGWAIA